MISQNSTLTNENISEYLLTRIDYIVEQLENSFLSKYKCSRQSELFINHHDLLILKLLKFIPKYNLPSSYDFNYNVLQGFTTQFYRSNYYQKAVLVNSINKTNREYKRNLSLEIKNEITYDKQRISENLLQDSFILEDHVVNRQIQIDVQKGYLDIYKSLTPLEAKALHLYIKYQSVYKVRSLLCEDGFNYSYSFINRIIESLKFRIVCYFARSNKTIYSEKKTLETLNQYPKFNKKCFGSTKLSEIPKDEILTESYKNSPLEKDKKYISFSDMDINIRILATKYDPNIKESFQTSSYRFMSKIDFNRKKHDHYVVYINSSGNAYCHVTKETKDLSYLTKD